MPNRVLAACSIIGTLLAFAPACVVEDDTGHREAELMRTGQIYPGVVPATLASIDAESLAHIDAGRLTSLSPAVASKVVACAFAANDMVRINFADGAHQFMGAFGIAPRIHLTPLSQEESLRMSACLAGHLNYYGSSVVIMMVPDWLPSPGIHPEDGADDGARYGDLFPLYDDSPRHYTCKGVAGLPTSPSDASGVCDANEGVSKCNSIDLGMCQPPEKPTKQFHPAGGLRSDGVHLDLTTTPSGALYPSVTVFLGWPSAASLTETLAGEPSPHCDGTSILSDGEFVCLPCQSAFVEIDRETRMPDCADNSMEEPTVIIGLPQDVAPPIDLVPPIDVEPSHELPLEP
jgi:hypothetical protein